MNRLLNTRFVAATALALGALAAASVAQARSDVYFSIGVQGPGGYVQPAPVYVQPAPVYLQPRPVYAHPRPVYVEPQPVFVPGPGHHGQHQYGYDQGRRQDTPTWERRGPYGDHDGNGIINLHDPNSPRNQNRHARLYGPFGDLDGDGVMNQDDRDRDGDGVRNRWDRFPDDPYRY